MRLKDKKSNIMLVGTEIELDSVRYRYRSNSSCHSNSGSGNNLHSRAVNFETSIQTLPKNTVSWKHWKGNRKNLQIRHIYCRNICCYSTLGFLLNINSHRDRDFQHLHNLPHKHDNPKHALRTTRARWQNLQSPRQNSNSGNWRQSRQAKCENNDFRNKRGPLRLRSKLVVHDERGYKKKPRRNQIIRSSC